MNDVPRIWTRRPKIIEPRSELLFQPTIAGLWRLQARRPDGRVRVDTGWFPNLITDVGLDIPGTSSSWVQSCVVGTGNTPPSVSDTALVAQIASTSSRIENVGGSNQTADRYTFARTTFRFAAGAAAGNIAEIGILGGSGGSVLLSRALILDGGGSPTTLTILSDEVLDATYEIRNYPPLTDVVTTMDITGVTHDIVIRAAEVDSLWTMYGGGLNLPIGWQAGAATEGAIVYPSTSVLGDVTGRPSGTGSGDSSRSTGSYTPGTYQRSFSNTWNLNRGNVSGGIAAALVTCGQQPSGAGETRCGMAFQISFDPVIPKNDTNNLVLNWRQSWARRSI